MSRLLIAINGSPRRNGNTAQLLQAALDGARHEGATTELIHLDALSFTGCRSCFACKRNGSPSYGRCACHDDLTPILSRIIDSCDALLLGTPIYFGAESGIFRCFVERLLFPLLRYDRERGTLAPRRFPVAFFYTMNVTAEQLEQFHYRQNVWMMAACAGRIFGKDTIEQHFACDTLQFDDYSRYDAPMFDPTHKRTVHETQFPRDLENARLVGQRLARGN